MFLFSSPLRFLSFVYSLYTQGLGPFLSLYYSAYLSKKKMLKYDIFKLMDAYNWFFVFFVSWLYIVSYSNFLGQANGNILKVHF